MQKILKNGRVIHEITGSQDHEVGAQWLRDHRGVQMDMVEVSLGELGLFNSGALSARRAMHEGDDFTVVVYPDSA